MKIHDQKISNSSKTFTFSADAVSTGSTHAKPSHLSRDGIFKITAYPVIKRQRWQKYPGYAGVLAGFYGDQESWPDDCDWVSGGVTLDNSFARDTSGDSINAPSAERESGKRGGYWGAAGVLSTDTKVFKSWGWGFSEGVDGTYCAHYRHHKTAQFGGYGFRGYMHREVVGGIHYLQGAAMVGAIFVYLNKSKTIIGEIPDWLKTSGGITGGSPLYSDANDYRNGLNIRPHFYRHFIDWAAGDTITGQIDNIADGSTTSGQDLTSTEWMVELWSLETALPAQKNKGAAGHYLITNDYPDKKVSGIRWRRWTSSGINSSDLEGPAAPVGVWFWPLWTYDVDLPRTVGFTGCGNELLRFAAFEGDTPFGPSAPWGWFPEDEYFNDDPFYDRGFYRAPIGGGGKNPKANGNRPIRGNPVRADGNLTFGTNGSGPMGEIGTNPSMPVAYSAGGGGGLIRPNHFTDTGRWSKGSSLRGRGGLWPLLTAQPLFDDGTVGEEMRMGAGFFGGISSWDTNRPQFFESGYPTTWDAYKGLYALSDGSAGFGCNAHYPHSWGGRPFRGGYPDGVHEGGHQQYLRWGGTAGYATCWQIDFSPTHPENRKPDTYETCVRADGAFFHQDPLHPNFGCP
jgi:hypothetical protein